MQYERQPISAELVAKASAAAAAAAADGRLARWPQWSRDPASLIVWQTVNEAGRKLAQRRGLAHPELWGILLASIAKVETGENTDAGGWQRRFLPPDGNLWNISGEYGPRTSQADADYFNLPTLAGVEDRSIKRSKTNPLTFRSYPTPWHAHANALRYLATSMHYPRAQELMQQGRLLDAIGYYAWPQTGVEGQGPSGYTPDRGWTGAVRSLAAKALGAGALPAAPVAPLPPPRSAHSVPPPPAGSVGVYRDAPPVGVYLDGPQQPLPPFDVASST